MLITMNESSCGRAGEFLYPVPGRPGSSNPTTGDVHLYVDPATQWTRSPLLYADCEGLDGGDKAPESFSITTAKGTGNANPLQQFRDRARRAIPGSNGLGRRTREAAVTGIFPRILYTFSDVVVFVMKEAR